MSILRCCESPGRSRPFSACGHVRKYPHRTRVGRGLGRVYLDLGHRPAAQPRTKLERAAQDLGQPGGGEQRQPEELVRVMD